MKTSSAGVNLIKSFEGFSSTAYKCPSGVWTVGYGHTGPNVVEGSRVTEQQAEKILKKDLESAENAVSNLVKINLTQHQFDALVSFTYNNGQGALCYSTLLKRLNAGEDPFSVAKEEFPRWIKGEKNEILNGLVRRRSAEVQLFCTPGPNRIATREAMIDITSKQQTWFKKEPISAASLPNDKKAKVHENRTYKNNKVLDHRDKHTLIDMDYKMGQWWIFDDHWIGVKEDNTVPPYEVVDGFRRLRNFPYFYQQDNGPEGYRQCQTSSIAMVLKYFDVKGINDDRDYLAYVNKYGDTTTREAHKGALKELNVEYTFSVNLDAQDVKDQIDKGLPVAAGILHHGTPDAPRGGGHFVVITGYSDTHWLVQDPFGELDLVGGTWVNQSPTAGKNQKYSFKNMDPRFFVGGKSNGWGWINFKNLSR